MLQLLTIPYSTWKQVASNNSFSVFHRADSANSAVLWCGNRELVYKAELGAGDYADWQAAFSSVVVESEDDAIAQVIGINHSYLTPTSSDGRPILLTARFRGDVDPYFAGCGDDPNVSPGRGEGPGFVEGWATAPTSAEDKTFEFQFNDWVYISGGNIRWAGGNPGDWVSFDMYCPASIVSANGAAPSAGNCNLANLGGYNIIVPAAGAGMYDIAASDMMPIPSYDGLGKPNGHWNWDEPDEGRGAVTPASIPGTGNCNMLDVPVDLVHWVAKMQLIGDSYNLISPETKARKVYPHWKFRLKLHNAGASGPFYLSWVIDCARKKTI